MRETLRIIDETMGEMSGRRSWTTSTPMRALSGARPDAHAEAHRRSGCDFYAQS